MYIHGRVTPSVSSVCVCVYIQHIGNVPTVIFFMFDDTFKMTEFVPPKNDLDTFPLPYVVYEESVSKQCSKCKEIYTLKDFYRQANAIDGHQSECKDCHQARRHK